MVSIIILLRSTILHLIGYIGCHYNRNQINLKSLRIIVIVLKVKNKKKINNVPSSSSLSSTSSGNALSVVQVPYTVKFGPNISHDHHDLVVDKMPNPLNPSFSSFFNNSSLSKYGCRTSPSIIANVSSTRIIPILVFSLVDLSSPLMHPTSNYSA